MSDMYNTRIPELLVAAIKNASPDDAERMFDDADFCARGLLNGLISTGQAWVTVWTRALMNCVVLEIPSP